jgi:NAD(P)-dependent dehydrogenase (short-subunit alcohol dehydrogenase family)
MFTLTPTTHARREPELTGRTVVVLGGTGDTGIETARRARAEGADVITAAVDANDQAALEHFFDRLPGPIDDVVVTAAGERIALAVARNAVANMRPGGTLQLMDGALAPRFAAALRVALAPVRIRVVAPTENHEGRKLLARAV